MNRAWIDGRPAALDAAIEEAARLLQASRLPVLAGLDCDVAGARAAIALARRLGGVCDQMGARVMLHTLDAMREAGAIVTTEDEARLRADTVLFIGARLLGGWSDLAELAMEAGAFDLQTDDRRLAWLCPGRGKAEADEVLPGALVLGRDPAKAPALLAALRARVNGRPVNLPASSPRKPGPLLRDRAVGGYGFPLARERLRELDTLAAALKAAKFGVAVWLAEDLDPIATEMLSGLIDDLNAHTRFAGVPVPPREDGPGVMAACGWLTGFPCPVGFGRGKPEHDPWRHDAQRLIESGEADCAVWVSVFGPPAPPWQRRVSLIIVGRHAAPDAAPVVIEVGVPGIDHDGVLYSARSGTIRPVTAHEPSDAASVADVLERLAAALPERPPC
jgi:formylmethanofuran dehydrogenase subunit B